MRRALCVTAAVIASACTPEFAVPPGANITCTADAECPAPLVCRNRRCLDPRTETQPPVLERITVQPSHVRAGVSVTVSLAVDEPLSAPPKVTLRLSSTAIELSCAAAGALEYTCVFTPDGTQTEGAALIDVRLVDLNRNEAFEEAAASVVLDFTSPRLAANSVEPRDARLGSRVQVFFSVSEELAGPARLVAAPALLAADGGALMAVDLSPEPGTRASYLFEHVVGPADPSELIDFSAFVVDLAGNSSSLDIGRTTIDVVLPALDGGTVGPSPARAGTVVVATFTVNKALVRDPEVRAGALFLERDPSSPAPAYRYTLTLDGGQAEGPQGVTVALRDRAGNEVSESIGSVTFDFTAPRVDAAAVRYLPSPGSVFSQVSSAAAGAEVTVTALANEPLQGTSQLTASNLAFPGAAVISAGATFTALVTSATPSGDYQPSVTWTDLAGNTAIASPLPVTIRVRTAEPPPVVVDPSLTYLRSPWGAAAAESLDGGFVIPAGPYFALAPADPLSGVMTLPATTFQLGDAGAAAIRVWADPNRGSLLGTVFPLDGGAWPRARLVNLDAPSVWVSGFDEAGNETVPTTQVPFVEWVATPNTSAFANPHRLEEVAFVEAVRGQQFTFTVPGGDAGAVDGYAAFARGEAAWRRRAVGQASPSARSGAASAYDSARGRLVVFGGNATILHDTWEWDGERWLDRTPSGTHPLPRNQPAMAYDAARGRVVLFGGSGMSDTWEWDGTSWVNRNPPSPLPPGRSHHAMVYDPLRRVVVMFGGAGGGNDVWEWDGARWTRRAATGLAPASLVGHAMAFDPLLGRVVMMGGCTSVGYSGCQNELWAWDGTAGQWDQLETFGPMPARGGHWLVFEPNRGTLLMSGGQGSDPSLWEYGPTGWVSLAMPNVPLPALHAAVAYDVARGNTVLFGGLGSGQPTDQTWLLNGVRWANATPSPLVVSKSLHALAYDRARGVVIAFGGLTNETAEWNGYAWALGPAAPPARTNPAMAPAPDGGGVVMTGGLPQRDTWQYTGAWTNLTTPDAGPSARGAASLATDTVRGRSVLFGGNTGSGETWEWTGTTWLQLNPVARPPPRFRHAAVYDEARQRVFLFGGINTSLLQVARDQWEWDGVTWVDAGTPGPAPSARAGHAMAYDSARSRVVLFGSNSTTDTWERVDGGWIDRTPVRNPSPSLRDQSAMTFDAARGRPVLVGGSNTASPGVSSEVWEWDAPNSLQSAVQFSVHAPPVPVATMRSVRVRAYAGGTFAPYGPADVGAELYGWSAEGRWQPLPGATNSVGVNAGQPWLPGAPALIPWAAAPGTEANWFLEREAELAFQVRPRGVSGATGRTTTVAVDYLEVRLRYAAP